MYLNLASIDESHDSHIIIEQDFITGSTTQMPDSHRNTLLTQGAEEDFEGNGLGKESFASIRAKKQLKKYRRD
jgi:hypothetical protein